MKTRDPTLGVMRIVWEGEKLNLLQKFRLTPLPPIVKSKITAPEIIELYLTIQSPQKFSSPAS